MPGSPEYSLTNKQRKQLQHEIKNYVTSYFKNLLVTCADYHKVTIWNDTLIIRAKNILTTPEKRIIQLPNGSETVRESRMHLAKRHAIDNLSYYEEKLGAKCVHQFYDIDCHKDLWIHVMIFDRVLIEV